MCAHSFVPELSTSSIQVRVNDYKTTFWASHTKHIAKNIRKTINIHLITVDDERLNSSFRSSSLPFSFCFCIVANLWPRASAELNSPRPSIIIHCGIDLICSVNHSHLDAVSPMTGWIILQTIGLTKIELNGSILLVWWLGPLLIWKENPFTVIHRCRGWLSIVH